MFPRYDLLCLSPHLDDAALSCGGQLWQCVQGGGRVLVATIMAGDVPPGELPPFARHHHNVWQLGRDVVAARRAEDVAACRLLGADWWHGPLPDCIYRRDPQTGEPLYNDDDQLFGPPASAEIPLITTLADQFRHLPSADTVLVPLTIGGHVDHRLVRAAAEAAWPARKLAWYDDYPYVQRAADDNGWAGLRSGLSPHTIPLQEAAVRQRIAAIAAFRSQMVHLFEGEAEMARLVREEIGRIGGERLWQPSQQF